MDHTTGQIREGMKTQCFKKIITSLKKLCETLSTFFLFLLKTEF